MITSGREGLGTSARSIASGSGTGNGDPARVDLDRALSSRPARAVSAGMDPARTRRVTLIVPCWNAGPHLRPLLDSLLAQHEREPVIVLVDDRSDDGSAEFARAHGGSRIEVLVNERRLGIAGNWNRCAGLVATPYFTLAHMDDVYEPEYAVALADALDADPQAGAAHCIATAIDSAGANLDAPQERYKLRAWRGLESANRAEVYRRLLRANFVAAPSVMWRRAAFDAIGGFDRELRFALDWDAALRLLLAGHELRGVPRALVRYRRHAASATAGLGAGGERYREEAAVGAKAHAAGIAAGLLPRTARRSRAAIDHLLVDVLLDLESGACDAAQAKLRFAREELPGAAKDPALTLVAAAVRCGRPGRFALRTAFDAFLALRAPRRHSM